MKKAIAVLLVFAIIAAAGISTYVYATDPSEAPASPVAEDTEIPSSDTNTELSLEENPNNTVGEDTPNSNTVITVPESFSSTQDEIVYKMLNSIDYFTTAQVSFSALFPGFDVKQNYTIETNLDTGVAHQTCSDNFIQTRGLDTSKAYETYSDGKVVREYNNLARTVQTMYAAEERRTLEEEWPGIEDRYFIDENGDPHYRYRGNPTNADMAGESLFPQVSAFAYLMDKNLWSVTETIEFCGRECYSIEGTVNDSYSAQIGADTFMMYVDKATGILLKLEASDGNGNVVSAMEVSEIAIDAPSARSSFEYDMSQYEGYAQVTDQFQVILEE